MTLANQKLLFSSKNVYGVLKNQEYAELTHWGSTIPPINQVSGNSSSLKFAAGRKKGRETYLISAFKCFPLLQPAFISVSIFMSSKQHP